MEPDTVLSPRPNGLSPDLPALRRRLLDPIDLSRRGDRVRGDHDLNPEFEPTSPLRRAAVLVPMIERTAGVTLLLTQRSAHLPSHAGQISFPGGALEPDDPDERTTALRESQEEVGIKPDQVELLGRLDSYITRTGFLITPFVGIVHPPITIAADPFEVADVFEVPLAFLMDPDNVRRDSRDLLGKLRHFYAIPYGERYIWGATAGMLINLMEIWHRP